MICLCLPLVLAAVTLLADARPKDLIEDEELGKEWLKLYNIESMVVMYDQVSASWGYSTNITDHNLAISVS